MKTNKILLVLIFELITASAFSQSLTLNDLMQFHRKNVKEVTEFLRSKNKSWHFEEHESGYSWWTFKSPSILTYLKKTDGDADHEEVIVITDNPEISKNMMQEVKANEMIKEEGKNIFVGKKYVVAFIPEKNPQGKIFISVHLLTKTKYFREKIN